MRIIFLVKDILKLIIHFLNKSKIILNKNKEIHRLGDIIHYPDTT